MSHATLPPSRRPRVRELLLAVALALLLLLLSLRGSIGELTSGALEGATGGAVLQDLLAAPALRNELILFVLAQVGLHVVFGVFVWALALATAWSGVAPRSRPWQLIASWFAACALWVQLANAHFYPRSIAGSDLSILLFEPLPGVSTFAAVSVLLTAIMATVGVIAGARSKQRLVVLRCAVWISVGAVVLIVLMKLPPSIARNESTDANVRPNVVVIGIDSLRSDMVGGRGASWLTPNIDAFLRESHVVSDTTTPLGRTFPAWISVLTGNHPQTTGARENLIARDALTITSTLAEEFRELGYRTVFATDEVRFSNIDASYGFDAALTPTVGAADFLVGTLNDLPLSNLIVNTRLGAFLFPSTYANRGAAATYRPETFVERLASEVDFQPPMFLAVHLTLPHWPFRWADGKSSVFEDSDSQPYAYLATLVGVDRQFRQLLTLLEERGALDNSIVVLLSDHGEGLGFPQDNLLFSPAAKQATGPLRVAMWGHGTSVLSPHQNSVVLAFRGYGPAQLPRASPDSYDVPASLEDVTPTLLELVGALGSSDRFDGRSLAGPLRGVEGGRALLNERFRFIETAFNPPALSRGAINEQELIKEGRHLFAVNRANGRVEFRMDRWPELMKSKERAVIQGDWMLAAIPVGDGSEHRYLLVNRRGALPRWLHAVPDATTDPVAAPLWEALHRRFPGELGMPAR